MSTATLSRAPTAQPRTAKPSTTDQDARMYAIAFDMDTDTLQRAYPGPSWNNAYADIQRVLDTLRRGNSRATEGPAH